MSYGVVSKNQILDTVNYVCDILGHGKNNNAVSLLMETARAETQLGRTKDKTKYAGMGLTQIDKIAFDDIIDRVSFKDVAIIKDKMQIELSWIKWEDLRYNILLAFIFTRLKYKKITAEIPTTMEARALYWKQHYNSYHPNAKGTLGHYMEANKKSMRKA